MPNIMDWFVQSLLHPIPSKLATKLNLQAEEEVTPVEGEVPHVGEVEEVEEGGGTEKVGEEKISKLTANRRLIAKVGKSIHSPLNPLSLLPSKILLHFLVRQLKVL